MKNRLISMCSRFPFAKLIIALFKVLAASCTAHVKALKRIKMALLDAFSQLVSRWYGQFAVGYLAGAGVELFKVHFRVGDISFYSVFYRKQLQRKLDKFEQRLIMMESLANTGQIQVEKEHGNYPSAQLIKPIGKQKTAAKLDVEWVDEDD